MKLRPMPVCSDCGETGLTKPDTVWNKTREGHMLCNDCWLDSWDHDLSKNEHIRNEEHHGPKCNCQRCQIGGE